MFSPHFPPLFPAFSAFQGTPWRCTSPGPSPTSRSACGAPWWCRTRGPPPAAFRPRAPRRVQTGRVSRERSPSVDGEEGIFVR